MLNLTKLQLNNKTEQRLQEGPIDIAGFYEFLYYFPNKPYSSIMSALAIHLLEHWTESGWCFDIVDPKQ